MRLTKSLKGNAKQHIQGLLVNPNNLSKALQQLEFFYGRRELLYDKQVDKVKSIKPILETHLEEIILMSIKVQNFVSFLKTMPNSFAHLCDPTLSKEIISKLPISKQDQWVKYASNIKPYFILHDFSLDYSRSSLYE